MTWKMSGALLAAFAMLLGAAPVRVGGNPPNFALKDAHGASLRLSKYRGKVVLLNFWATTCGGCKTEIPWFVEFQEKYKKSGLRVIGVSLDEDGWKSVRPFLAAKELNYEVVVGSNDLANAYGVEALPVTVLIGRDGKVAAAHTGVVDRSRCEREIGELLAKKK